MVEDEVVEDEVVEDVVVEDIVVEDEGEDVGEEGEVADEVAGVVEGEEAEGVEGDEVEKRSSHDYWILTKAY